MHASARPARTGLLRRLRRAVIAVPLSLALGLGAMTLFAPSASAHGSVTDPPTRNYGCWERWGADHLNPQMATLDPMCWQAFQDNPNAMWNWNGLFREGVGGQHQAVIPDGQLCSGGRTQNGLYKSMDTVGAWKAKQVPNTFTLTLTDSAKHGADYLKIYVTKQGFDPTTQPLTWASLDLVKTTGSYPTTGLYQSDISLPGRSGRAVLYTIWQASHLDQPYYLCSDIVIGQGTEPTQQPTQQPTGACTATVKVNSSWSGGYVADVVVTAGSSRLTGWKVTVGGATISQAWGGTLSGNVLTNAAWNGALSPGGTATAGFLGSGSSSGLTASCSAA